MKDSCTVGAKFFAEPVGGPRRQNFIDSSPVTSLEQLTVPLLTRGDTYPQQKRSLTSQYAADNVYFAASSRWNLLFSFRLESTCLTSYRVNCGFKSGSSWLWRCSILSTKYCFAWKSSVESEVDLRFKVKGNKVCVFLNQHFLIAQCSCT